MKDSARAELRRRSRSLTIPRDMDATAFTILLAELIARIPGARAAALVDRDGESIDYAGNLSPFDVKVAAAHWQIVLADLGKARAFLNPRHVVIRGLRRSYILRALADTYAVVVVLAKRAGFAPSSRAFGVFERALVHEAGIGNRQEGPSWTPVVVEYDARARPKALASTLDEVPQALEVLGTVMGLRRGERGYRVRTATGAESTVVREPGGVWYADEPFFNGMKTAASPQARRGDDGLGVITLDSRKE